MNVLIADSGSTKTDWIFVNSEGDRISYSGEGLNPYFRTQEQISKAIKEGIATKLSDKKPDKIFFYGSGTGNESKAAILKRAIQENFSDSDAKVETDILGAAIACFGTKKGIACILGTGSGACLYEDERITQKAPSLGFILGDEGSGGYFGKKILSSYYNQTLPEDLKNALEKSGDMSLETVIPKVYEKSLGNMFVASFSKILMDFNSHPFIRKLIREGFEAFANTQLTFFAESKSLEIGFVGSIASKYEDILKEVLEKRGMKVAIVVRKPLDRLVEFHTNN